MTPALVATITEGLAQQWSSDQLKGRCQQQGQPMLSRAAIYAHIWRDQRQGGQLYKDLPHTNRPYRKHYGKPDGRGKTARPTAKPSIDQWPAVAAEKSRFGDWELDTVLGPSHQGVLVTITERSSNYLLMQRVDDKSAAQTRRVIIGCLRQSGLPVHTLTLDNGTDFADHEQIAKVLNTQFYFAHPYHAWERGANEHDNKLSASTCPKSKAFPKLARSR